jgi:hypothetical protein
MSENLETEADVTQETTKTAAGDSVSKALSSFMVSLEAALSGRGNSIMVRVNDDALQKLDMLINAGICKSRSESAAFLLQRGMENSGALFDRIASVSSKISQLRQDLLQSVRELDE